jgi:hypothetical protein
MEQERLLFLNLRPSMGKLVPAAQPRSLFSK